MELARKSGLMVRSVESQGSTSDDLASGLRGARDADMVLLEDFLSMEQRMDLFRASNGVLANSWFEPFGLVGLETMAVGGVAFVGSTGEDYAMSGYNAICLQTKGPDEIAHRFCELLATPEQDAGIRRAARSTANTYRWESVVGRNLLPIAGGFGAAASAGRSIGLPGLDAALRPPRTARYARIRGPLPVPARRAATINNPANQRLAGIHGAD